MRCRDIFFSRGGFDGEELRDHVAREFFRVTPFVVLAAYAALWLATRLGREAPLGAERPGDDFSRLDDGVGPGLIVNLGLKDHWGRPRPYQTQDFNGQEPVQAMVRLTARARGTARSSPAKRRPAFWMVAPASLLPPPWRAPAIVAAFAFGAAASLLRLAFGGHYLSDVLLGGLITLIVIEGRRVIWPRRP